MMTATAAIAEGNFEVRLASTRPDELGSLSRSIDRMAARLETYVRGQKRFLGDIAHELRSPLGRMQVALGILERRLEEDPPATAYIHDIHEEVDLMSGLTDELLTFAKAELRTEPLPLTPVNVAQVIERAIRVEVPETVEIHHSIDPALHVLADSEYLFRAISNILRNAVRYAAAGGPIAINAQRTGDRIQISTLDSGPGIPEQDLSRVFEPFFRPEASRDRRKGGTGLGLAIVRTCIEACHGTVSCHNRIPTGLEVAISLPAA
jgi:two-component system sensor histidine kinase CpxA